MKIRISYVVSYQLHEGRQIAPDKQPFGADKAYPTVLA